MDCIPNETKGQEYRNYLRTSGVSDLLTEAFLKLYKENPRPEDSMKFIREKMFPNLPNMEEVNKMKEDIKILKREIQTFEESKKHLETETKKTDSEIESLLRKLFATFDADETRKSLLKKHLSEDIFDEIMDLKTDHNAGLLDNIVSGLTVDSEIGIFASDPNAYETFEELFQPVLVEFFDTESEVDQDGNVIPGSQKALDWGDAGAVEDLDCEGLFIKSISIRICRAFNDFPFAPVISFDQLNEIVKIVRKVLTKFEEEEDLKGKFYEMVDIEENQRKKWIEEGILFNEPNDAVLKAAETYRLWPTGRGLFLNNRKNFRFWVNEEEHLQIFSFDNNGNLGEIYRRLVKIMEKFEGLKFARNDRWGFLVHNLKNIGNTMKIAVKAKLPQMSKDENHQKLEDLCNSNDLNFEKLENGRILLSNKRKIGPTEFETVKAVEQGLKDIILAEKCAYIS